MAAEATALDYWQLKKSVLETNKHMYEKQLHCDVSFTFTTEKHGKKKDKNVISAHKYMLISRSPVFCAMFTGPAKDENSTVRIDDADNDSFNQLLRFIYFEEAALSGENVLSVLYLAKKYMIQGLQDLCAAYLQDELDESNACLVLEQASLYGEKDLEERCLALVDDAAAECLQSEGFKEIGEETMMNILKRDTLKVNEMDVYRACLRWAEAECERQDKDTRDENKREVLGDIIRQVRFPLMGLEEFVESVLISKVVLPEESVDIMLAMKGLTPHQQDTTFSTTDRESGEKEEIYRELPCFRSGKTISKSFMRLEVKNGVRKVVISRIYFATRDSDSVKSVYLNGEKTTFQNILDWKAVGGFPVYVINFEHPVVLTQEEPGVLEFILRANHNYLVVDGSSVKNKYLDIVAPPGEWSKDNCWNHLIGLKYEGFR